MTPRLPIDDRSDQDQTPVYGTAEAGGCSALRSNCFAEAFGYVASGYGGRPSFLLALG